MNFAFDFDQSDNRKEQPSVSEDAQFEPINIDVQPTYQNNEAQYILHDEDYTLSEVIKHYLQHDDRVSFVGSRKHHPLEKSIEIRIKLDKNHLNGKPVAVALIDCLKDAASKAYNDYEHLRRCIPGIDDGGYNSEVDDGVQPTPAAQPVVGDGFKSSDFDFGF